jgi:hypothetical protein
MVFEERWSKAYFYSGQGILGILTPFRISIALIKDPFLNLLQKESKNCFVASFLNRPVNSRHSC